LSTLATRPSAAVSAYTIQVEGQAEPVPVRGVCVSC
jgi:hypothetical protein